MEYSWRTSIFTGTPLIWFTSLPSYRSGTLLLPVMYFKPSNTRQGNGVASPLQKYV